MSVKNETFQWQTRMNNEKTWLDDRAFMSSTSATDYYHSIVQHCSGCKGHRLLRVINIPTKNHLGMNTVKRIKVPIFYTLDAKPQQTVSR